MTSIDRNHRWVAAAIVRAHQAHKRELSAPFSIGEVCEQCDLSRPAITRHLMKMVESGMLHVATVGNMSVFWRVDLSGSN